MPKRRGSKGSKGSKKSGLHDLRGWRPNENEWNLLFREIEQQSDRAAAIIAASFLEETLLLALQCVVIEAPAVRKELFEQANSPLGTFGSRITMGHALGVYDDSIRKRLDAVRAIRNVFAHTLKPIDFSEPSISRTCSTLPLLELPARSFPAIPSEWDEARKKYIGVCYRHGHDLVGFALHKGGDDIHVGIVASPLC